MSSHADTRSLDDASHIHAAMKAFLAKNAEGGVLKFSSDGPNYNESPIPARFLKSSEPGIVVRFESAEHFQTIHKRATEYENTLETEEIDSFNKEHNMLKAWPLLALPCGDEEEMWIVLVESKPSIEMRLPNVGETCQLRLVDPITMKDRSTFWTARRAQNNFVTAGDSNKDWSKLIVFNVTLARATGDATSVIQALVTNDESQRESLDNLVLSDRNAVNVRLFFSKSEATFDAEMGALNRMVKAAKMPPTLAQATRGVTNKMLLVEQWLDDQQHRSLSEPKPDRKAINSNAVRPKQAAAFKYMLDFRNSTFTVNMFESYPHMLSPDLGSGIPLAILKKYMRMNEHQRRAYHEILPSMPCGLCFLPGGPGGGKTDWVMCVIGLMQSKSSAKVLYLLDINDPLDDATAKYIKLMKNADLGKKTIRMRNFGTELRRSARIGTIQHQHAQSRGGCNNSRSSIQVSVENEPEVDFSRDFLRVYTQKIAGAPAQSTKTRQQFTLPTLDEAAWDLYESHETKFPKLTELLETCHDSAVENRALRFQIFNLYQTVLDEADFVATTPCVAATAFRRMFRPDLVVFDEAAHARELSTLIAIANFCPTVGWIFIGDHRQTQPTVKSNNTNPYGKQLATSVMERAYLAGVLEHQLLINHRAFGRLERLPSKLIYDGKMVSGIPFKNRYLCRAPFVRSFFDNLAGTPCNVPRLIVHLAQAGRPVQMGTSWYHPEHMKWTMKKVLELVQNKHFRSAENPKNQGTILLLAPYKAAVAMYQQAIDELSTAYPQDSIRQRVEARTWDSSQGHEADIVAIDYVRDHPTSFMDSMYRFNVGLTRARQGEWHLMHPRMPTKDSFRRTKYLRRLYDACESGLDGLQEGRVVTIDLGDRFAARLEAPIETVICTMVEPEATLVLSTPESSDVSSCSDASHTSEMRRAMKAH